MRQAWEFVAFIVLWIGLLTVHFAADRRLSARAKRRLYPWWLAFLGLVLAGFFARMMRNPLAIAISVPLIAIFIYMNVRDTTFCPQCDKTVRNNMYVRHEKCPHCGGPLRPPLASR